MKTINNVFSSLSVYLSQIILKHSSKSVNDDFNQANNVSTRMHLLHTDLRRNRMDAGASLALGSDRSSRDSAHSGLLPPSDSS